MNTKTITPPDNVKAIFPIKGNEAKIDEAARKYNIAVYPNYSFILFEGYVQDYHKLRDLLKGGAKA